MPDTDANQAVYPQQPQQAPGLGFPILRLVVLRAKSPEMVRIPMKHNQRWYVPCDAPAHRPR